MAPAMGAGTGVYLPTQDVAVSGNVTGEHTAGESGERGSGRPEPPGDRASPMRLRLPVSPRARQWTLAGVVVAYLLLGSVNVLVTPGFEKPDEEWHFAYVTYLLDHGDLPPISPDEQLNPAAQEAGQPPLYYLLAAGTARVMGLDHDRPVWEYNPYWGYPVPLTWNDNKNRVMHEPGEWDLPGWRIVLCLRGLSLLLGAGAVVFAYALGRDLTGDPAAGIASAALVALLPQYLFIAGSVSNDALVASLSGAALWVLVRVVQEREGEHCLWPIFGVLAGLAALTKTNALVLTLLGAGTAVLAGVQRRSLRFALAGLAASAGGLLLVAGWWYLHNLTLYGDPLGVRIHFVEMGRSQPVTLAEVPALLTAFHRSFWASFGWGSVGLDKWVYSVLSVAEFLAVVGLVLRLARWVRDLRNARITGTIPWPHVLAAGHVVGTAVALMWWVFSLGWSLGRLLFPALVPLAVWLVYGWLRAWRRLPAIVLVGVGLLAIVSPSVIARAYQGPALLPRGTVPRGLKPVDIRFGDLARLYAFDVSPQRVRPDEASIVTLCWEALGTTSTNYVVFVQAVGPGDRMAARRHTHPGLGTYPTRSWHAGDAFCDQYRLRIDATAPGPGVYAIQVGLYDPVTHTGLPPTGAQGEDLGTLSIDRIKIVGPGADVPATSVPVSAEFGEQIALLGYEFGGAGPDGQYAVTLYWQARAEIAADYTVFVHVLDAQGTLVSQADSQPQAGTYPTGWWDPGEIVADVHTWTVPQGAPPGPYRLRVGLYIVGPGTRLPLAGRPGDALELDLAPSP